MKASENTLHCYRLIWMVSNWYLQLEWKLRFFEKYQIFMLSQLIWPKCKVLMVKEAFKMLKYAKVVNSNKSGQS